MLIFLTCPIFFLLIFYKNFVEVIKNITDHFRRIWIQDILIIFGRIGHYWDFFWPRCAGCGPVSLSLFFLCPLPLQVEPVFRTNQFTEKSCMQGQLACKIILCVMQSCEQYNPVCWTILWAGQSCVQDNPVGWTTPCAAQSCLQDNTVCRTILCAGQSWVRENPVYKRILGTGE